MKISHHSNSGTPYTSSDIVQIQYNIVYADKDSCEIQMPLGIMILSEAKNATVITSKVN